MPSTSRQLPIEVLEEIFTHLYHRLNPNPSRWWDTVYINNKTFIKISLVCKDWHKLATSFRSSLFIASEKGARRFISTFRRAKLHIEKLHYSSSIPEDLLVKLLPLIQKKSFTALSVPVDMIQGRHVYHILKNESTLHPIQSLHIHGKLADDYHTSWWKKAYIMHNIPTLTELSLTGLFIKGIVHEVSAAIKSPIKKLQLERLRFQSSLAIEHLCRPILYDLEEARIASIACDDVHQILDYLGTSWVGLRRLELHAMPDFIFPGVTNTFIVDTRSGEILPTCGIAPTINDRMHRVRALFALLRQMKFETAVQVFFFTELVRICTATDDIYGKPLNLPEVFRLRKSLDKEQTKEFRRAYALLSGSNVRPNIIDPPEFFDIYGGAIDDDSGNWDGPFGFE